MTNKPKHTPTPLLPCDSFGIMDLRSGKNLISRISKAGAEGAIEKLRIKHGNYFLLVRA